MQDDCSAGLQWTHENRAALGISKIIIAGESGGGNLSIATTMKAVKDGKKEQVQGTYAMCPYIAGPAAYENPQSFPELRSLIENNHIFLDVEMMAPMAYICECWRVLPLFCGSFLVSKLCKLACLCGSALSGPSELPTRAVRHQG